MIEAKPSGSGYDIPTTKTLNRVLTLQKTLGLKEIYEYHKDFYGVEVEFKEYETLLRTFFKLMREEVMDHEYVFNMPFHMGFIAIKEIEAKVHFDGKGVITRYGTTAAINMKYLAKMRKELRYPQVRFDLNIKTLYKMRWFKGTFKNRRFYYLEPNKLIRTRLFQRHETH